MSTSVMKALRFAELGPPSLLRIAEVTIPEPGEGGSNRSRDCCGDQPQRHRERLGTLQEHNFAANPRPGFCPNARPLPATRRPPKTGVLRPPPIDIVPFAKGVEAYNRVAVGQAKAKQVLSFDWG